MDIYKQAGGASWHLMPSRSREAVSPNLEIDADNWDRQETLVRRDHAETEAGLVLGSGIDSLRLKMGKKKDITRTPKCEARAIVFITRIRRSVAGASGK